MRNWLDTDLDGLAKILEKRGKKFAIAELLANAWDQRVSRVTATLLKLAGRPYATLTVLDDDPEGFATLSHAYTLFAESAKKTDAEKRGRFNLGEKLVLAVCESAEILTTTGGVRFDDSGRHLLRSKRVVGSQFSGVIRMNQEEYDEAVAFVRTLIPPAGICTLFNGEELQQRPILAEFTAPLLTEVADAEGYLRRVIRNASVRLYAPLGDEIPSLYELGIPVVETGDQWHYDVAQKVPLNMDRDNVPPAYLQKLRALALNANFQQVRGEEAASATWIKSATESPDATREAVEHMVTEIYGNKRVISDPSDPEANKLAVATGHTLMYSGSLSPGQWANVKRYQVALPAGQVTPSNSAVQFSLEGKGKGVEREKFTAGMSQIEEYVIAMTARLQIQGVTVGYVNDISASFLACYGDKKLTFNVGRLGYGWFDNGATIAVNRLLIHELGHEYGSDHLSSEYHDGLCRLGAKMTELAIKEPEFFKRYMKEEVMR